MDEASAITEPGAPTTGEYRYSPTAGPGHCPIHSGCVISRCHRFLCSQPIHLRGQRGQPRRFCTPACRVAEHRRLR